MVDDATRRRAARRTRMGWTRRALLGQTAALGAAVLPVRWAGAQDATPAAASERLMGLEIAENREVLDHVRPAAASERLMGLEIEPARHEGGILVQAVTGVSSDDPLSVNPVIDYENPLVGTIFERLIEINPETLEPVGNLATGWEVADDGLRWTLRLRDGVRWHDGAPFTARDVKFTYDLMLNDDALAPDTVYLQETIAAVEVVDDLTVAFAVKAVTVDFLADYVYWYPMVAEHVLGEIPPADLAQHPSATGEDPALVVGTGPFRFAEGIPGDRFTAVRNDDYWDGRPSLDEYINLFVSDRVAAVSRLQAGEIDVADIDPALVNDLDPERFEIMVTPYTGYLRVVTFNVDQERQGPFVDASVRRALRYALDIGAMIEAANFGYGTPATGTLAPEHWANNPDAVTTQYDYGPERARQLLDEAGWIVGDDGVRAKDGQRLSFTVWVEADDLMGEACALVAQEFWREVGVESEVSREDTGAFFDRISEQSDFDCAMMQLYSGFTGEHGHHFVCGGNLSLYCNEEVDALFRETRALFDQAERIDRYTRIQNILADELPIIPLFFPQAVYGVNRRVHNYYPNALVYPFNAETWWVEPS